MKEDDKEEKDVRKRRIRGIGRKKEDKRKTRKIKRSVRKRRRRKGGG